MSDFLDALHWREYLHFLGQGTPPVAMQLLIANAVLLLVWIVQRMRADPRFNERSGIALAGLMLITNAYILIHGDTVFR